MDGYIRRIILKYGHPSPIKPQLSSYKHCEVVYSAKEQLTPEDNTNPPLDIQGTNASRASSAPFYIMLEPWITSYSLVLVPLGHSRPPTRNAPRTTSIKYLITASPTPMMELSIAPATWSYVHILTQVSTTRAKDAAELELTFFFLKQFYALMERICAKTCQNR